MVPDRDITFSDANNTKNKYHFKIFDLDNRDMDDAADEAVSLINEWHGEKYVPEININMCSNDDFIFKSYILNGIKNGIAKIFSLSYPFILTKGLQKGTTRFIGSEVGRTFKMISNNDKQVKLLGFVPWDKIVFAEDTTDKSKKFDWTRPINETDEDKGYDWTKPAFFKDNEYFYDFEYEGNRLEKNHSHFIFIKKTGDPNAAVDFKNKIIKKKFSKSQNNFDEETISILIVLNGDNKTLEIILDSLENNIPVLLIRETKGVADLLASLIDKYNEQPYEEKYTLDEDKLYKQFEKQITKESIDLALIKQILGLYSKKIDENNAVLINSMFFENQNDEKNDSFLAILLDTIAKGNIIENDEQKKSLNIMSLSLKLDLVKVGSHVRDCLNTMCDTYDEDDYFEMLEASLIENKPNYFKFLIDEFRQYPEFLKEFLTSKRLYYLYNFKNEEEDEKKAPFSVIFKNKNKSFYSFKSIIKKLNALLDVDFIKDFFSANSDVNKFETKFDLEKSPDSTYINEEWETEGFEMLVENPSIENHIENMFLWAILFNRVEIAKTLLSMIQDQIGFAMLAAVMFKQFYQKKSHETFIKSSREFEEYAIEILDLFDKGESDDLNYIILQSDVKYFQRNLLTLAYSGGLQKFITTFAVQKCLLDIWNNGYINESYESRIVNDSSEVHFHKFNWKWILSYSTVGVLAPFLLYPKSEENENTEKLSVVSDNRKEVKEVTEENKKHEISRSYIFKYKNFICSPRVNFIYETVAYFFFILLFSYYLLCELKNTEIEESEAAFNESLNQTNINLNEPKIVTGFNLTEYVLTFWIFGFNCRLIFEAIVVYKTHIIWNKWNYWNLIGCIFFYTGIVLRIIAFFSKSLNVFSAARIIFCIDILFWFIRFLYTLNCFETLGPKIIMIGKMSKDLFSFLALIAIFLVAYGVTVHAMLYPGSELNSALLGVITDLAYWPLFGQITLLSLIEDKKIPRDAQVYGYSLTAIYMFLANILLLNLLIAMFSNTYNAVDQNANQVWRFNNFKLIYSYRLNEINQIKLWPTPPPINLINLPVYFIKLYMHSNKKYIRIDTHEKAEYEIIAEKINSYTDTVMRQIKENKE